ncbi:MAG: metallophosphoesterase family protein [Caldisericia bacterium]
MGKNKIAIISDIHANIEALTEVYKDIEMEKIDEIICLGDIVGYGPNPNEAIEMVKNKVNYVIKGNHDEAIINENVLFDFNEYGIKAIEWQKRILKEEGFNYIKTLNFEIKFDNFQIVHGALSNYFKYIMTVFDALEEIKYIEKNILFIGHSHRAGVFDLDDKVFYSFKEPGEFILEKNKKYIINPGSIGQPRDYNPLSSYLIFNQEDQKLIFKRVPYEFDITREKIIKNGLPQFLGDRLIIGF